MTRYLYILIAVLALSCSGLKAQYLVSSNTSIASCNQLDTCMSANNISYLYYDERKGEFFLKLDFSKFRSVSDTGDHWLNKEKNMALYFRAFFPLEKFPVLGVNENRSFKLNGRVFYHGTWKDQPVELTLFAFQNSLMNTSPNNPDQVFENYKVNFTLPFVPTDFKDYEELHYYDQVVNINVTLGRINLIKPGMESLLSEIYFPTTE
jgi:hypothetical protein